MTEKLGAAVVIWKGDKDGSAIISEYPRLNKYMTSFDNQIIKRTLIDIISKFPFAF